jgi:hypothetical protein
MTVTFRQYINRTILFNIPAVLQFSLAVLAEGLGIAVREAKGIEETDREGNADQIDRRLGLVRGVEGSSPDGNRKIHSSQVDISEE